MWSPTTRRCWLPGLSTTATLAWSFDTCSLDPKYWGNPSHSELPYYGEFLTTPCGLWHWQAQATATKKRFGKIANPTVHIGLNQVRVVVNALIKRYGHPSEVIVEVARDLKQSQEQREEDKQERQAKNQKRNERLRDAMRPFGRC
jgi:hypothetical protein